MGRLKSRDSSISKAVQKEFDSLLKGSKEYKQWDRWRRRTEDGQIRSKTQAILNANREGYLEYGRQYRGSPARLLVGTGFCQNQDGFRTRNRYPLTEPS